MKNTERFSDRVENYVKYRPHYPNAIVACLEENAGLTKDSIIADIGAGTGISSVPFLKNGNKVIGVEPNKEMRAVAEQLQQHYPGYRVVNGSAEQTTLPDHSVDLIIAGQAFHWFNPLSAKIEFQRIAKPNSYVALIWNERDTSNAFEQGYEKLVADYGADYKETGHKKVRDAQFTAFFSGSSYKEFRFENSQHFDYPGLRGRLLSSSYIPNAGPTVSPMMNKLQELFEQYNQQGMVKFHYVTRVYVGRC